MMMMKVTILSNSKGGVFTVTMQWAKGLARRGCNVNIFFLTQSEEARRLVSSERIHFYFFTTSFFLPSFLVKNDYHFNWSNDVGSGSAHP